jgi:hypothetical protein
VPDGLVSDNSNTQFAVLGVWAAGRHGVPVERALAVAARRFRVTQAPGGSWGYRHPGPADRPAMTAAGLLGLAVGHALRDGPGRARPDPAVEAGLAALARHLGKPPALPGRPPASPGGSGVNLYLLWSVQRVGLLYGRPTIGATQWYGWGARALLARQQASGAWATGGYNGATPVVDTSLALLFLRRADLTPGLADRVRLALGASPGGK